MSYRCVDGQCVGGLRRRGDICRHAEECDSAALSCGGPISCTPGETYCDGARVLECLASGKDAQIVSDCAKRGGGDVSFSCASCAAPNGTQFGCQTSSTLLSGTVSGVRTSGAGSSASNPLRFDAGDGLCPPEGDHAGGAHYANNQVGHRLNGGTAATGFFNLSISLDTAKFPSGHASPLADAQIVLDDGPRTCFIGSGHSTPPPSPGTVTATYSAVGVP